ncbi:SgcJ/EcaC family oxidoreductase [Bosea sp. (in: a-proteobacteria)]|uniref:SgcJ/EcaC family oxidoreductase n=1 Tax=Bosea sp. (in: a-proteobacteria) TaxID=1871050 RepID=UPI00334013A5
MKSLIVTVALFASAATAAAQTTMSCALTNDSEIAGLFDNWNTALKTGRPEAVAGLYAEDAILLPTVSNKPRLTNPERLDYFAHFMANRPQGQIDERVIRRGCNDALDAGLYTFTYGDGRKVSARYSFTYVLRDGRWLIQSHHSSMLPEPAAPKP